MMINADATQLSVAIRALIQNSLEALSTGGRIELSATTNRKYATITVSDDGPGIPPDIRPHIFEPFFSGREAGRGLGFGLSKCWRIVTDHGGEISVEKLLPQGAVFRLQLPLVASRRKAH
jgi:signal transduction histidine kinase